MSESNNEEKKGFSSRVMNMKFMRKAEVESKLEAEQTKTKKLQDASEWKLPSLSNNLKLQLTRKPKIKKADYSSIFNEEGDLAIDSSTGRRTWGEPEKAVEEDEVEETRKPTRSQRESKEFFDKLWKNQRKEDDSILDSLNGGISGAGSSAAKRKVVDSDTTMNKKRRN